MSEEICKNCKYHYMEEISFDYPQSCCNKTNPNHTTEEWLHCDCFEYSKNYITNLQQKVEQLKKENKKLKYYKKQYKNIIDRINNDLDEFNDELNTFKWLENDFKEHSIHYYQLECLVDYLKELRRIK